MVGLGYGDEGKGTMVDYLCRHYGIRLVIRYNGGSQAAHNVVTDTGSHHTFSQIGSGSFIPGAKTLLSKFMFCDPFALANEAAEFSEKQNERILDRHYIDERTPIITPFHVAVNCLKEWVRGQGRHGSCGKGVGETAADLMYHPSQVLRAEMLGDPARSEPLLATIQARKLTELRAFGADLAMAPDYLKGYVRMLTDADEPAKIAAAYAALASELNIITAAEVNKMVCSESSIFEGAQGVLLDEWHGFHPHTTWSTITAANAVQILAEAGFEGNRQIIGVVRIYGTRHGAGPFVTHDPAMRDISPTEHNGKNEWQGTFRTGKFDGVQFRYALDCLRKTGAIDAICLTHLDILERGRAIDCCDHYRVEGKKFTTLEPNFGEDLIYQEGLTKVLLKAEPIVTGSVTNASDAIAYIEATSGISVKYLSFGQRPRDKKTR